MKTSAPVHVDRLARALKAQGIDIRRSTIIELVAAAFGYHNSNEFQAAARAGDLAPAPAVAAGRLDLDDGTPLVVLRDGEGRTYAIGQTQDRDRLGTIGITPYGGLVTLPDLDADMPSVVVRQDADTSHGHGIPAGSVIIDLDTLSTLAEAADANADALHDNLEDDSMSSDDIQSTQETLDAVNAAVIRARGLYGTTHSQPKAVDRAPAYDASRFVLVSREALDRVVGAASSHLEDAETGVDDGIYDSEENLWTTDLQAAIDAVESARPLDPIDGGETRSNVMHVAIMRTEHVDEVRFSTDPVSLDRIVADHCRGNWGSLADKSGGDLDPRLLPDTQVIEMFYAAHAGEDEPAYSLERREEVVDGSSPMQMETTTATLSRVDLHPRLDAHSVAQRLKEGLAADIWDTDAPARRDAEAVIEMADAKSAMAEAAEILMSISGNPAPGTPVRQTAAGRHEPVWLTDVEGDVIYDVTRDQLENLGLDYDRGDGKNEWLPLTSDEFERLQPGSWMDCNDGCGKFVKIDGLDGIEIRLGQSCLWKDTKWMVPAVEFDFGEGERDEAYRRLEAYVRDLTPLVEAIGGSVRTYPDATDYAHSVDVFVPMETVMAFQGADDLMTAMQWLLCPEDLRDGLVRVLAGFETFPHFENRWDATFDVLLEGRAWAQSYLMGDRDEQQMMRLAESGLAHKDAWNLWNGHCDLELDIDALKRLYSIR